MALGVSTHEQTTRLGKRFLEKGRRSGSCFEAQSSMAVPSTGDDNGDGIGGVHQGRCTRVSHDDTNKASTGSSNRRPCQRDAPELGVAVRLFRAGCMCRAIECTSCAAWLCHYEMAPLAGPLAAVNRSRPDPSKQPSRAPPAPPSTLHRQASPSLQRALRCCSQGCGLWAA